MVLLLCMFFIYFIVFTFVFTVFENVSVAIVVLLLIMSYFVIAQFLSKKKIKRSTVLWVLLSFFLVGMSFGIKERRYYGNQVTGDRYQDTNNKGNFVGTGVISDVVRQGRYVFDCQGEEYVLVSEKKFAIGDGIRIVGSRDQVPGSRVQVPGPKYWHISKETFAVPIFS